MRATDAPPWDAPYKPDAAADAPRDEALEASGAWRAHVADALRGVQARDLPALTAAMEDVARRAGLTFPIEGGTETFHVDPVPRVLSAEQFATIERGVTQRIRALDAFVADVHGERRAVREGVVPERVIDTAEHHEPGAPRPPQGVWVALAGLDLVQDAQGEFLVLEDNARTPSGIAYTLAARALVEDVLGIEDVPARPLTDTIALLRETLEAAGGSNIIVLTDGPGSSAYWEHRTLAIHLDAPLVTHEDLALDAHRRLILRDAPQRPVDVVYRRTDGSSLAAPGHEKLLAADGLGIVNAFGTGVADDKLAHAYVEDLIRLYLGEEPALRSVPTFDLADPRRREEALDRLNELVVKPRGGAGGQGVVIGPHAEQATLDALRTAIEQAPDQYVAQELVAISTHPTVVGDRLEPRHVDLRPFAFLRRVDGVDDARVLPGGLTRVALPAGSMVVNSSQDGGAKDTWVLR
ncbi:circularly permuted type 2 ATP-grasp protein [Baekduia sp. Peel2402]|uniref:circularly permuted type 2 ATP-grasp protein n=1 Tax=Baekduia sp. Peel2402 TaxID=3458296 RepID=UPI00403E51C6